MEIMTQAIDNVVALLWSIAKLSGCIGLIILITVGVWTWVRDKIKPLPSKFMQELRAKCRKHEGRYHAKHHGDGTKPKPSTPKPEGVRPPPTKLDHSKRTSEPNRTYINLRVIVNGYVLSNTNAAKNAAETFRKIAGCIEKQDYKPMGLESGAWAEGVGGTIFICDNKAEAGVSNESHRGHGVIK